MMTESKAKPKAKGASRASKPRKSATKSKSGASEAKPLELLAGGDPQIAKADGDAPVPAGIRSREQATGEPASRLIDQRIRDLGGWRGETLARMRALILEADPEMTEEWKWMGTPVWSHHGIVCTGESYTKVVKLTFARGAKIPDPSRLFNSSLEGNTRRAIDIHEGEKVDAGAFKALVKAAAARNGPPVKKAKPGAKGVKPIEVREGEKVAVVLLSGGNPQIAKADGDAPVQAYIAAMPGWKRDLGKRLDALIARSVPDVRKAVRWNSPFYGIEGQGWFLSFHVLTHYVKVTFFRGMSLRPVPSGGTVRSKDARWIDIREGDQLDEEQMATWVKQAAVLPGWVP
ncbi:DUF1801 domain-containing protein [Paludisphaera borealis]|nr:DUF1801 domain-containing protein [Paludisphaera borealis]